MHAVTFQPFISIPFIYADKGYMVYNIYATIFLFHMYRGAQVNLSYNIQNQRDVAWYRRKHTVCSFQGCFIAWRRRRRLNQNRGCPFTISSSLHSECTIHGPIQFDTCVIDSSCCSDTKMHKYPEMASGSPSFIPPVHSSVLCASATAD